MNVLKFPSQYVKAIVAFLVATIGALISAGLLSGKVAIFAGSVVTGLVAFGAVFGTPNKPERIDPSV